MQPATHRPATAAQRMGQGGNRPSTRRPEHELCATGQVGITAAQPMTQLPLLDGCQRGNPQHRAPPRGPMGCRMSAIRGWNRGCKSNGERRWVRQERSRCCSSERVQSLKGVCRKPLFLAPGMLYRRAGHSPRRVLRKCVEQCAPQRWRPTNGSRTPGGVGLRALTLACVRGTKLIQGSETQGAKLRVSTGTDFAIRLRDVIPSP